MATISAQVVKDLREKTGAGMMDAKKALEETGGDFEKAVDVLRKSAEVIVPALTSYEHYSNWLDQHPMQYISPTDRLQDK